MPRFVLTGLVLLSLLSIANGAVSPRQDARGLSETPPASTRTAFVRSQKSEYVVTEQTEIKLDGRACKYSDVPHSADIIHMEIASNQSKTILKIYFRSKK